MKRYCFCLQVRPDLLDEYTLRHSAVWPAMLTALAASGWHRYSIFARDDGMLIGYVEAEDLAAAQASIAATEVNTRWQLDMRRFFAGLRPDENLLLLTEIFNLDEQLERLQDRERGDA